VDPPSHRSDGTRAYGKLESSEQAGQIPLVAVEKRQASQELAKGKAETGFSGWEEAVWWWVCTPVVEAVAT
jgi:hypothetical protein